jgi:hypothetical protein
MSAIYEWFGIYNMIFRHIKTNFGDKELDEYINYIGDSAYDDISAGYKEHGLEKIRDRYKGNFIKDGGNVTSSLEKENLSMNIECCPAFKYMLNSNNPFDKPEDYYCDCCIKLNKTILENAGYILDVSECSRNGRCKWTIKIRRQFE